MEKSNSSNPLHPKDKINETFGCRHTNPKICKNNHLPNKCAFVREDNICLVPPISWKKRYSILKDLSKKVH